MLICLVGGLFGGAIVGYMLGTLAPDFCQMILKVPNSQLSNTTGLQIGIGLGIANGAWVGLIAGIVLVLVDAVKGRKEPKFEQGKRPPLD
jgi:hypothetical protein